MLVLLYAITQGLLPRLPEIPDLPAFEISFWVENPEFLMFTLTVLVHRLIVLFVFLARRVEAFWARLRQGVAILREPRRYLREVVPGRRPAGSAGSPRSGCSSTRSTSAARPRTVLLVMSVQAIAGALPFTPGGAGAQQALLVATLSGPSRAAVLAYSVGQQAAVTVWSLVIAIAAMVFIFRHARLARVAARRPAGAAELPARR